MGHLYALRVRDTETIRYIGVTKNTAQARFKQHVKEAGKRNSRRPVTDWIRKHGSDMIDVIVLLESEDYDHLLSEEVRLIKEHRDAGTPLLNLTSGGEGTVGWTPTPEWLKAVSPTGRKHSEETKKKMSEFSKGRLHTPETKEKLKSAWTEERKAKTRELMSKDRRRFVPWTEDRLNRISELTKKANHTRWHTNRAIINKECAYCTTE